MKDIFLPVRAKNKQESLVVSRKQFSKKAFLVVGGIIAVGLVVVIWTCNAQSVPIANVAPADSPITPTATIPVPVLDTAAYDLKMLQLANLPKPKPPVVSTTSSTTTTTGPVSTKPSLWPVKAPYPNVGAVLPFNRIVAYYGNFYSKGMGILGQYPQDVVLTKLAADVQKWKDADPSTPVIPAIHYIATTAQKYPGTDKKHILRMPFGQIDKALAMAKQANGILFIDVQLGGSDVQTEIPMLEKYLMLPQVHLGVDPEFAMKPGKTPGTVVGSMNASQINWVAQYLAKLVKDNRLPPKILIVHRFTQDMVTGYKQIKPLPEVQIVMDMDGWGTPDHKITTYKNVIYPQPVQFTGFKLFYRNDLQKPSKRMMTPIIIM
jgi:hypothetical protein